MIRRLLDTVAPVRPAGSERGYRRLLRWAALPVTNRRWAAPLSALALGFGLFVGVAIGPGAAGTLATGGPQIIELPSLGGDSEGEEEETGASEEGGGEEAGGESSSFPTESSESNLAEFESGFGGEAETFETPPARTSPPPAHQPKEEEEEGAVEPEAETVSGTVVNANPAASSYAIVEPGGTLAAIHASKLPAAGTEVSVPVRVLANGTLAEAGKRKATGKQTEASFNGTVTFVDPDPAAPAYAVSKRGVSVLVRVHPDPTGVLPPLPVLGAYARVEVDIEKPAAPAEVPPLPAPPAEPAVPPPTPGCSIDPAAPPPPAPKPTAVLWQRQLDADGAPFTFADFAGIVAAVCPAEGKLLFSADDSRAGEADVVFTVPKEIDTSRLRVGESVVATATIGADGTLALTGLASDERTKGADDVKATQGELVPQTLK